MVAAEIELKFRVFDKEQFERTALDAGFHVLTPRTLERNTLYDTPDRTLRSQKQLLRIRQYGDSCVLTHKRPGSQEQEQSLSRFKLRQETETEVEDGEALSTIFHLLGYLPVFHYEKFRTEFSDHQGKLVLDETPIGIFAEAEGEPDWIDRTLERLSVSQDHCFTDSYGKLFEKWLAETGSPAEHMTFEQTAAYR